MYKIKHCERFETPAQNLFVYISSALSRGFSVNIISYDKTLGLSFNICIRIL